MSGVQDWNRRKHEAISVFYFSIIPLLSLPVIYQIKPWWFVVFIGVPLGLALLGAISNYAASTFMLHFYYSAEDLPGHREIIWEPVIHSIAEAIESILNIGRS